jgi:hypothetical protein
MVKHYKIHPGIGIARLGNSPEGFFIGDALPRRLAKAFDQEPKYVDLR